MVIYPVITLWQPYAILAVVGRKTNDRAYTGDAPRVRWIDNHRYVLGAARAVLDAQSVQESAT